MAEPEGYERMFVDEGPPMAALLYQALKLGLFPDYVARLLALFPTNDVPLPASPIKSPFTNTKSSDESLIEPLSPRELEVLQLIASGASNEDIAANLVIAPTTAKKHVSNILQKLGVENRTQAVARGRSLGLCQ
jgi:LuxR family maltose regulon positive regulatory protein